MSDLKAKMEVELTGLDFIQAGFQLEALAGGAVNSSYRLSTANSYYFVKTFESDKITLLDRQQLFDIQLELSNLELAVQPVYLSKSEDFQIDRWLDAPMLEHPTVSNLTVVKRLAAALTAIHKTKISAPKLDLPSQWQHYISLIDPRELIYKPQTIERYAAIWRQACTANAVFCHNDLSVSHVTNTQPSKIFDWEYCAISCPYYDLASCIAVNGLGTADEASLCALYAQNNQQRLSKVSEQVTAMKPLVALTNWLWYQAAGSQIKA